VVVILPDINLLVYAYDSSSRHHETARQWWEDRLNGSKLVGLSWVAVLGFIRLLTNPRIFNDPYPPEEILAIVESWLELPHVKFIHPSDAHFSLFSSMIKEVGAAGNLTTDAHLATLALERGMILYTTDADFTRFPGLKWKNPMS
jgi:toxin-antitoxin system PIN domain toxin